MASVIDSVGRRPSVGRVHLDAEIKPLGPPGVVAGRGMKFRDGLVLEDQVAEGSGSWRGCRRW